VGTFPEPKLGLRAAKLNASATVTMHDRVLALRAAGISIISLGLGEPDFDTPVHIREAAKRALDEGATRYTNMRGTTALRTALADHFEREHGVRFSLEELMVSSGAKQVLFNLFQVTLDAGDEVIVPRPSWTSYPDLVSSAGGRPAFVDTTPESGYTPSLAQLERARSARTRAIVLCSPNNPTGAVLGAAAVSEIARWAAQHRITLISDDIYRGLSFHGPAPSVCKAAHEAGADYVIIDGVSKMYAMTGWRIGFAAGHAKLIHALCDLQSQSTTCASSVSQAAALAALAGPQTCVAEMRDEFARRGERLCALLRALPDVRLPFAPQGAFYALPDFRAYLGARNARGEVLTDDKALVSYLLDEAHVAVVAGSVFGAPGFIRIAFAASIPTLEQGMAQIGAALARLSR
jgi:aspartate aminotransferase